MVRARLSGNRICHRRASVAALSPIVIFRGGRIWQRLEWTVSPSVGFWMAAKKRSRRCHRQASQEVLLVRDSCSDHALVTGASTSVRPPVSTPCNPPIGSAIRSSVDPPPAPIRILAPASLRLLQVDCSARRNYWLGTRLRLCFSRERKRRCFSGRGSSGDHGHNCQATDEAEEECTTVHSVTPIWSEARPKALIVRRESRVGAHYTRLVQRINRVERQPSYWTRQSHD